MVVLLGPFVAPWHEVAPRLWMGSSRRAPDERFQLVVSLSGRAAATTPPRTGVPELVVPLRDLWLVRVDRAGLDRAVAAVLEEHGRGGVVLVRCRQGQNRSGLVVGEVLAALGHDRSGIVATIRAARHGRCLDNPRFRAVVEGRRTS